MSIFGVGVSALSAAQAGLTTTSHNISNVNTPGFHRQQIVQSTNIPQFFGIGFLGQGTHVDTVKRLYNELLDSQVIQAQAQSSQLDTYYSRIQQIDNMLADPNAGLSPALQEFFNGVQDVAANPASVPSRQAMLSSGQAMVSRFQAINQRFSEIRDGVNSEIRSSVGAINSYAQQIASMNQQIVVAQSSSGDQQPANDLLDQREQLVAELNKLIKVSTVKESSGSLSVFIGNGQTLVINNQSMTMAAVPSLEDPERFEVGLKSSSNTVLLSQGSLQGGSLGGILAFRSETLDVAQNQLGRVAIGLAQTFNDQHQLGMDLNGALGGDFFNVSAPKVIPNTNNTGVATVGFSDVGLLTTSDYKMVATGPTTFTLTRLSDGSTVTPPGTSEGLSINLTGATIGDSFLIKPTINGAQNIGISLTDPVKIAAAAPIKTNAEFGNTGSGTISAGVVNTPPPTNVNLQQAVTITFNTPYDGNFDVVGTGTGAPTDVLYTPGDDITYNGWTIQITGTPSAGDKFTVDSNANGVADNRNALLLAGLQTQNTLGGGTTNYQGAYSQLVSLVGNKTHELEVTSKAQASLVAQTQQAQQSLSGVNLDEEAANLMRYQQAYQAAGKMMQIAGTLFDTLLSLGN